jgi:hypothetical protein
MLDEQLLAQLWLLWRKNLQWSCVWAEIQQVLPVKGHKGRFLGATGKTE